MSFGMSFGSFSALLLFFLPMALVVAANGATSVIQEAHKSGRRSGTAVLIFGQLRFSAGRYSDGSMEALRLMYGSISGSDVFISTTREYVIQAPFITDNTTANILYIEEPDTSNVSSVAAWFQQ